MKTIENEGIRNGVHADEGKITIFKKLRAKVCHHCPLCRHARNNPDSTIGKILHHKYHSDYCPFWKAEKEVYGNGK